ncbi:hypothetical protein Ahy_A07g035151 [Arachis hypogaea]|uniref:Uncharacterized protein n=1 Tax=Arachis hypogaea TaxID=3818 RepID=A0A445CDG3_ARAHY|nr:hypothetical protein Ahy_A07g035151 [Arachis hypogaea]
MIIVAWNGSGNPSAIFNGDVFKKVLRVFITAAILKLGQVGKREGELEKRGFREGELEKRELTTISSYPLSPILLLHSQLNLLIFLWISITLKLRIETCECSGWWSFQFIC